jgi:pimeloyl-ACP methyl ester carboxylesterase
LKAFILISKLLLLAYITSAQSFDGTWEGKLQVSVQLRVVLMISTSTTGTLKATLKSPDQSSDLLFTDTCFIKNDSIFFTAKKYAVFFKGKLNGVNTLQGVFTQGRDFPLTLNKVASISELKRPQTPRPPFNYHSEEITFHNSDHSIQFAGTLSWPATEPGLEYFRKPVYPAAILISGSGPQDRDETIFGHKPFAVLADYLTKKGFAILRVDERGIGKSTGNFNTATSADFANDTEAAIHFLKNQPQIDTAHIGLIGHSEGGMIAAMVAARRKDVHFVVMMAAPGMAITKLMNEQVEAIAKSAGNDAALVQAGKELFALAVAEVLKQKDSNLIKISVIKKVENWATKKDKSLLKKMELSTPSQRKLFVTSQLSVLNNNWYRYFLGVDPPRYLTKLQCNVLALNGSKDIQVLPASNLAGLRASLKKSKSPHYEVKELPGLNHLFQTCKTCTLAEYGELEETFSPAAMDVIGNWLLQYGR